MKLALKSATGPSTKPHGFTIVELLVVIVVIGILATITVVSYTGISQKAVQASIMSDLNNNSTLLKMYYTEYGSYPTALDSDNCPTSPADIRYCLKPSPDNNFAYSSSSPYQTFSLVATHTNGTSYVVTDNSQPTALAAAPLSPVADWLATTQGDHYGNYYDLVNHDWASVTRSTPKTIYDPNDGRIHDVPANYLAMNPWSAYQTGGRGSAAVIEETRINYLTNSYGATNDGGKWTTGWNIGGSITGAPVYSLVQGVYGATALRIRYTGVAGDSNKTFAIGQASALGSFAAGESATGSVYASGTVSGCAFQVSLDVASSVGTWLNGAGGAQALSVDMARKTTIYNNLPTNTSYITQTVYVTGIDIGDIIDITIDAAQLEKGAFATSYIPTTTTTVTRNADVVTLPTNGWNAAAGTTVSVVGPAVGDFYILSAHNDSAHGINMSTNGGRDYGYANLSNSEYTAISGTTVPRVLSLVYADGTLPLLYRDGTEATGGRNGSTTVIGNTLPATAAIRQYNSSIQRITIYPSALSSSDISTVTNAVKDGP